MADPYEEYSCVFKSPLLERAASEARRLNATHSCQDIVVVGWNGERADTAWQFGRVIVVGLAFI